MQMIGILDIYKNDDASGQEELSELAYDAEQRFYKLKDQLTEEAYYERLERER